MADRIHALLKKNGMEQKDLAKLLGKNESEISKWLTGTHNFTLRTLSTIEKALGGDVFIATGKEKTRAETKFIYVFANPSQVASKEKTSKVNVQSQITVHESALFIKSDALA